MTAAVDLLGSVQIYMRRHGWVEGPPGPVGSMWHQEIGRAQDPMLIGVPDRILRGTTEWRSVIERLAAYEGRSLNQVEAAIRDQFIDVTQLRSAGDIGVAGSIPLTVGVSLVSAGKTMLRAAATTAFLPRAHIAGNFSKPADDIAKRARLGHTLEGSYVIPLLMPLPEPIDQGRPGERASLTLDTERIPYEPAERRVTRTLAQALAVVQHSVVDPAREPQGRDVLPLVAAGVSRELIVTLSDVLTNPGVQRFEAIFRWAEAIQPPGGVPVGIEMPAEAAPLLVMTAGLLKSNRTAPNQIISGPIVEVRHLPGDPFGEIAVQAMRRGRMNEIRVRLQNDDLDSALEWMREARAVLVQGRILSAPGQPLRITAPTSVGPLDETLLPDGEQVPVSPAVSHFESRDTGARELPPPDD